MEFEPIELGPRTGGRMATAVASSAVVHLLVLAVLLSLRPPAVTRPVIVLPVSLVSLAGGGDGSERAGGGEVASPAPEPAPPPAVVEPTPAPAPAVTRPKPVAKPKQVTEPRRSPEAAPTPSAVASIPSTGSGAGGIGTAGSGAGPGGGSGAGLGSGAAPAYGVNPEPPYPIAARRLGLQGTVVLRVVVAPDGSPASVAVLQSSGHAILDTAAADTVRGKWRFVPARRNGVPVEDAVQVPIRFHQTAG